MSFFQDPIGNISGALHKVDQSPIGKALEGAALMAFAPEMMGGVGGLFGGGAALGAGITVGGIAGLSSGNLAQGLMAGLSAYGGADISEGLASKAANTAATANELSAGYSGTGNPIAQTSEALTKGGTLTPTNVSQFTVPSSISDTELGQAGLNRTYSAIPEVSPATPMPESPYALNGPSAPLGSGEGLKLAANTPLGTSGLTAGAGSSGLGSLAKDPSLWTQFKNLSTPAQLAVGLGGLGLLKASMKPQPLNAPKQPNTQNYRYYNYSPFGGYSGQGVVPVTGATGGIVALAGGGMPGYATVGNDGNAAPNPASGPAGQLAFNNEPVMRMAKGGVAHFDGSDGSWVTDGVTGELVPAAPAAPAAPAPAPVAAPTVTAPATQSAEVTAAINAGRKGIPGATAQDFVTGFNLDQAQAAQVAQALGYTGDLGGLNYSAAASAAPTTTTTNPSSLLGLAAIDKAITGSATATPAQAGQVAIDKTYLNSLMNPTATDIANFQNGSVADKNAAISRVINAANDVYGGNNAQSQAAIAKLMDLFKVNPDTVQGALGSSYTGPSVQSLYNAVDPAVAAGVAPAYSNQGMFYSGPKIADALANTNDPNSIAKSFGLTGDYKSLSEVATKLGLPAGNYKSMTDIIAAISALSAKSNQPVIQTPTNQPVLQTNQPATLMPVTVSPFAAAPQFTGIQQVANTYTKSGGSSGYVNPAPASMAEFTAKNDTMTGGSKAAFDYLMGKSPYPITPTTPTGEIAKPYQSSVMGMPLSPKYTVSQPYVFNPTTKTYVANPAYDPNFSATKDYIQAPQTGLKKETLDFLKAAGLPDPTVDTQTLTKAVTNSNAADASSTFGAPADFDSEAYLKAHPDVAAEVASGKLASAYQHYLLYGDQGSKVKDPNFTYIKKAANGGLMALAAGGGMSVGHLGGYSDGGRLLRGPGDGVSDSIPATIGSHDPEPARLADGEFVVPARIVSELGNGSTEAGARQLYKMMDRIQHARRKTIGKERVATNTHAAKYLPA